ncbi:MAG: efflux RND transporter periplasmic adaptor subunit [Rhizobacter sp.]|nr:efflux RND transporter periplasmic adaptor subunit [Rhizobacter sp.]
MKKTVWWWALAAVAVSVGLAGCGKGAGPGEAASGAGAPASGTGGPPVSVSTVRAVPRDVDVTLDATGTVTALNSVEVRPQVSSTIAKVHIREGQFVKAGTLLFTLDARADEVNVAKARATLAKDQAALADARRQLTRSRELLAQNFVSQSAVDASQTLVDSASAVVAADRAAVEAAQVTLGYSRITAPSAGRAGAINVFPGSYVQPAGSPLVTITQIDPVAVAFNLPQRNLGDALQALRAGAGHVTAVLPEGRGTLTGRLQFVDNAVDAASGTVKVKAVFDNRDEKLWPGAYVSVRMVVRTLKGAITVPQASIIQGARGQTVYVVGEGRKAALRAVRVLEAVGDDAVVEGVAPGDRVVLDGRQNVRPGSVVIERGGDAASAPKRAREGAASVASR